MIVKKVISELKSSKEHIEIQVNVYTDKNNFKSKFTKLYGINP